MIVLKIIFWICIVLCLSGCFNDNYFPGETLAERVISQKGCPVLLHPPQQNIAPPSYSWHSPSNSVITSYSFLCRGQSSSIDSLKGSIYDCDGLNHSLTNESFKEIHPKLIEISRLLQKSYSELSVLEGFCCARHFQFLEASGKLISPKNLLGKAAILAIPGHLSIESISNVLKNLFPTPAKTFQISDTILECLEYRLTLYTEQNQTKILIEILSS
ncbi:hypothetical protein [Chlamydia sp. 17-3921]|nr:hypothetical protein [Chlamydia sp. 17-3921]